MDIYRIPRSGEPYGADAVRFLPCLMGYNFSGALCLLRLYAEEISQNRRGAFCQFDRTGNMKYVIMI